MEAAVATPDGTSGARGILIGVEQVGHAGKRQVDGLPIVLIRPGNDHGAAVFLERLGLHHAHIIQELQTVVLQSEPQIEALRIAIRLSSRFGKVIV